MRDCEKVILDWLGDAYTMEMSASRAYKDQLEEVEGMSEMKNLLKKHIDQADDKSERLKNRIEALGGDVSKSRDIMAKVGGWFGGVLSGVPEDKMVKNAIANHGLTHIGMANYMAIMKAAEICGDGETADLANELMEETTQMGEELKENLPMAVEEYLREE